MSLYTLPHFEPINIDALDEYYDTEMMLNDKAIQIDLNFENKSIAPEKMDQVKNILAQLLQLDQQNKTYIANDFEDEDGDTVRTYVEHHLEEIGRDELAAFIDFNNANLTPEQQCMHHLHLVRLGLYPDSEDYFATFDYSLGKDLTDYLVVINIDAEGQLQYLTMES